MYMHLNEKESVLKMSIVITKILLDDASGPLGFTFKVIFILSHFYKEDSSEILYK